VESGIGQTDITYIPITEGLPATLGGRCGNLFFPECSRLELPKQPLTMEFLAWRAFGKNCFLPWAKAHNSSHSDRGCSVHLRLTSWARLKDRGDQRSAGLVEGPLLRQASFGGRGDYGGQSKYEGGVPARLQRWLGEALKSACPRIPMRLLLPCKDPIAHWVAKNSQMGSTIKLKPCSSPPEVNGCSRARSAPNKKPKSTSAFGLP